MRRLTVTGLMVTAAVFLAGAVNDPGGRFTANLTGADVRPPVDSETDGRFSISFNEEETEGRVYLRVNDGVGITEAHLHCHDLRLGDPIVVTLLGPISGGEDIDKAVAPFFLDDEQIAAQNSECAITNIHELREAIVKGEIYADVHSVAHPGGEIQGQVSFYRQDTDGDGLIDRHDPDIDGDGIVNEDDPTPYTATLFGGGEPSPPQGATGAKIFTESYADIPWHQKLSTKDSNLIDIPIVMPYEALPADQIKEDCRKVSDPTKQARCMLRYGIVNIMGFQRTDTLYKSTDPPPAKCPDTTEGCVEVKLTVQRFHTQNKTGTPQAELIRNNKYVSKKMIPNPNPPPEKIPKFEIPSLGYAITEATMFAPWLPWYTGHYCAQASDGVHDAVCYEDYFTTMIQATGNPKEKKWLKDVPDEFLPHGVTGIFPPFCLAGKYSCDLKLGKVNWLKNEKKTAWATDPMVLQENPPGTKTPCKDHDGKIIDHDKCQLEVEDRTDNLVKQFKASIEDDRYFFDDKRHYPWDNATTNRTELQKAIQTNPFIGAYDLTFLTPDMQGGDAPPYPAIDHSSPEDPMCYPSGASTRIITTPDRVMPTNLIT